MRRDQLEHATRTACQIIDRREVIVVGSQAILGTYSEDELPTEATMSVEVDILPIAVDDVETEQLADLIEGVAGEFSPFEELHGFSIDGVDLSTAVLPAGWRDRLVRIQNANTAGPSGEPQFVGWCLDRRQSGLPLVSGTRGSPAGWFRPEPAARGRRSCRSKGRASRCRHRASRT
jgi:hypothetical protein